MSKPHTSVRSVRLTDETWERVAKAAEGRQIKINAAMVEAVERWLSNPTVVIAPERDFSVMVNDPVTEREAREAFWRKTGAFNPKSKK